MTKAREVLDAISEVRFGPDKVFGTIKLAATKYDVDDLVMDYTQSEGGPEFTITGSLTSDQWDEIFSSGYIQLERYTTKLTGKKMEFFAGMRGDQK